MRGSVMDIFTTQLTRVVPVPIKRANLKVKALVKESAAHEISEEIDGHSVKPHLNGADVYEGDKDEQQQHEQSETPTEIVEPSPVPSDKTGQHIDLFDDSDDCADDKDLDKSHLDIFV